MNAKAPLVIGYFSLEFGLAECLPIYSGGLGVLAGDHLKATSDLGLPLVAVGLLYKQGFGRQEIDAGGRQVEVYSEHRGIDLPVRKVEGVEVEAPIGDRKVKIAVWRAQVGRVPLFLLDTDLEANPPDLRAITDRLYVPEPDRRLRQEIVLGIGGVRALHALGMVAGVYHLNEGHSFLCAIERIRELRASRRMTLEEARLVARAGIVFTTHTPIAAGSDYFEPGLVWDLLGPYLNEVGITFDRFMDLGRQRPGDPRERLCTTYAALRLADQSVGVSRLHGAVSKRLWKDAWKGLPEVQVPIGSVTNGVHMPTWVAPEIRDVLRRFVGPDWWDLDGSDGRWEAVFEIPAAELWSIACGPEAALARRRSQAVRAHARPRPERAHHRFRPAVRSIQARQPPAPGLATPDQDAAQLEASGAVPLCRQGAPRRPAGQGHRAPTSSLSRDSSRVSCSSRTTTSSSPAIWCVAPTCGSTTRDGFSKPAGRAG